MSLEKKNTKGKVNDYVHFSFTIAYILLLTTATITIIEALRTQNPIIRHVLNLETCISIVAGYFYSVFLQKVEDAYKNKQEIDWDNITQTRYIDWSITTPMMLLTLCIVLGNNIQKPVIFGTFLMIVLLNYMMLFIGYLGEIQILDPFYGSFFGFIPFFGMFYLIFSNFVQPKYILDNYILFGIYLGVWSLYGIVYLFKDENKNIAMNILDLISKCLIGLGLWAYYVKIFKF